MFPLTSKVWALPVVHHVCISTQNMGLKTLFWWKKNIKTPPVWCYKYLILHSILIFLTAGEHRWKIFHVQASHSAKIIFIQVKVCSEGHSVTPFDVESIIHLVNCELTSEFFFFRSGASKVAWSCLRQTAVINFTDRRAPWESFLALDSQPVSIQSSFFIQTLTTSAQAVCQAVSQSWTLPSFWVLFLSDLYKTIAWHHCYSNRRAAGCTVCVDRRRRLCQSWWNVLFKDVFSLLYSEKNLGCDMKWCMICSLRCYLSVLLFLSLSEDSSTPLSPPSLFNSSSSSFLLQPRQLFSFTSQCVWFPGSNKLIICNFRRFVFKFPSVHDKTSQWFET